MRLTPIFLAFVCLLPSFAYSAEKLPEIQMNTDMAVYTCRNVPLPPGSVILGCYTSATDEIFIREGMSPERTQEVINHEIAHHLTRDYALEDYEKFLYPGDTLSSYKERLARLYARYRQGELSQKDMGANIWFTIRKMESQRQREEKY